MAKTIRDFFISQGKTLIAYTLIPVAIFVLFKKLVFELFSSTFVKFIFSKVSEPSTEHDKAAIFISLVVFIFFARKIFKGARIPSKWFYLTLTYCFTYFWFRFNPLMEGSKLQFISFKDYNRVYLLDLTVAVPLLLLVLSVLVRFCKFIQKIIQEVKKDGSKNNLGFRVEEPLIIGNKTNKSIEDKLVKKLASLFKFVKKLVIFFNKKYPSPNSNQTLEVVDKSNGITNTDDLLGRIKFIKILADQIKTTTPENGSFPIGISASWGSGKTTFLKSLLK